MGPNGGLNETQVILVSVIGVIVFLLALIGCGVSFALLKRKRKNSNDSGGKKYIEHSDINSARHKIV